MGARGAQEPILGERFPGLRGGDGGRITWWKPRAAPSTHATETLLSSSPINTGAKKQAVFIVLMYLI